MNDGKCENCGRARDIDLMLTCDCLECERCEIPSDNVVKMSPGEFVCLDCMNDFADSMAKRYGYDTDPA